ncbi:MAG: DNA-directed RNA polymerase subunit alpha [Candidatus Cloacimonetes bacterium]|nr:DNA-directed RNA polymerase subunit alpha [Candidatus Cloacimonadota bacterium]MCF7814333.1 DNA-directed RNA polymerase subunit alpha [Candidatus Cloacimonadota bacterium]MCF7868975.1 DNA-directed RNA polymerase subunit alpha [Candidatus Cloacimonadota bacterium]MCF7884369.1 DNA-directed RNA polymerase subunit alpha [Candidatus Cloacimonadota bacterium]
MKFIEPLQLPEKVQVDEASYSPTFGKFEIGPLEQGFATTIGNTLRRVLLSSIQGAAVRFVKIEGLHHEFAPIPGSTSDYIDLILKLKKLVIKCDSINEEKLVLEHKGKGMITAAEIKETGDVKIINKELELLEMTQDEDFRMELWVGIGRGYHPAEKHDTEEMTLQGIVPVDSIYSPINKVNFMVENQRVGEKIDYDKLIMEVSTDGSVDPKDALYLSAKILRDLYDRVVLFETEPEYIEEVEMDPELERMDKILDTAVNELELSVRCSNCLAAAKIDTIGELVSKSENEMLKYRNFGKKSLEEITSLLDDYDLSLGMNVDTIRKKIEDAKNRVTIKK